jgi:epoxyqueuosine reductase
MHGEMQYMERNINKRLDPTVLVSNAKSVISVLLNYFPGNPVLSTTAPKISRYALSADYHTIIKTMLWQLLDSLRADFGEINGRAFVDSAPVLERAWAQKAGLGWIGKNSMLINPKLGSYTFIGELILDVDIEPSRTSIPNRCGSCTRCIDSCPTGAILAPQIIDAQKCISYLTIEKKSPLTTTEQESLNGWCFGCDICQEACPWNSKATPQKLSSLLPKEEVLSLDANKLLTLSEENFNSIFSDTPVLRTGYKKFIENAKHSASE